MLNPNLTQEYLQQIYLYDPNTGSLYHKRLRRYTGREDFNGYPQVRVLGKTYRLHQLIWLYVYGEWVTKPYGIDHIDGLPQNNKLNNLRKATSSQNLQNLKEAKVGNLSGLLGVSRSGNKFRALITKDYKAKHIGTFDTAKEAHEAYLKVKRQLHPNGTL